MVRMEIPGRGTYDIENLVVDLNGTLSVDGRISPKAKDKLNLLAKKLHVYVLTADTRGDAHQRLERVRAEVVTLAQDDEASQKLRFLKGIGPDHSIVIGNGYNDHLMVKEAVLGIVVIGREGAAGETVRNAGVVVSDILDALDLILKPLRHRATLRG